MKKWERNDEIESFICDLDRGELHKHFPLTQAFLRWKENSLDCSFYRCRCYVFCYWIRQSSRSQKGVFGTRKEKCIVASQSQSLHLFDTYSMFKCCQQLAWNSRQTLTSNDIQNCYKFEIFPEKKGIKIKKNNDTEGFVKRVGFTCFQIDIACLLFLLPRTLYCWKA